MPAFADAPTADAVLANYADIAEAGYTDALTGARALDKAIDALIADPSPETLMVARDVWGAVRPAYQETEAYRFGNPIVDDWEPKVNAWPLDEGFIDYVDPGYYGTESDDNPLYTANVIANKTITVADKTVDASTITPALLASLAEAGGSEANVTTGYHAIEFLLWGEDTNRTGPGAGNRPATDYSLTACTHGNCDRRAQYLKSASTLLISDLTEMVGNWAADGKARAALKGEGIGAILTGMGSLSYGELAGQRMKLGLLLHDPEEEHDCFSDLTYNDLRADAIGIRNVYVGSYLRPDGTVVSGPSVSDLVAASDPALDKEIRGLLDTTLDRFGDLKTRGDTIEKYDQMIGENNPDGNAVVQAVIDALVNQTHGIERAVAALKLDGVTIGGDDSLDNPNTVFK
ncbi:MAG TPA: imelysin family protein [Devosia sp.]|nr:imelysin family protein [Devosia sp.]